MRAAGPALAQLLALAGRKRSDDVAIDVEKRALKTRFYTEDATSAALAAGGAIAADIWETRTGKRQQVRVSTREAAAGLVSFMHQKFADPERAPPMRGQLDAAKTAANGFQRTRDGRFIFLHPSFPESTKRLLRVLGCKDEPEAVKAAVASRDASELENAVAEARACAGIARSPTEWDASEQGRMTGTRPVVEVVKIGDSEPEPFASGARPLSGIRVLDLTRVLAGPTCARTLAQYGAEAMVVASPALPSVPMFVTDTGHGKLSTFIDLTTASGRQTLQRLIREADVFSQGYRQGSLARLGFGPAALAELRPGIVVTEINCYGHEGPWRTRAGWEQLAQTVSGMAIVHGGAESPKLQPGAVTDYTTGYLAAFGTLVALLKRAQDGGSYLVRVSLTRTAMWIRALGLAEDDGDVEAVSPSEVRGFSIESDTRFGQMTHLRPAVHLSETPAYWARPVVPLGTHPAEWPV